MTVLPLLLVCFTSIKPPLVPRASPPTSARKRRCCDCECETRPPPMLLGKKLLCHLVQTSRYHHNSIPQSRLVEDSPADALLVKIHNPVFLWKVYGFSALLQRGALAAKSAAFHCSGYNWYLKVSPMHKTLGDGTPHVALSLVLSRLSFKPDYTMNAVFVLSMYNHSKGNFLVVKEVLFLQKKKFVSVQNLFLQKKDFTKGDYTWTMNNFPELDLKPSVLSPAFEIGRRKCKNGWGWSNFIALNKLKDLVGSSCIVKADITIIGSSSESQIVV
uniref:MATH domain-containing protein n=1 Tax=Oryza sativa subsp. japonica TaxID=39947 RepID=Q9FWH3_ORYSJ|nr:hypothetical protein [Oryza sativa Japonica Group]